VCSRLCVCARSVFSIPAPVGGRERTGNIVMLLTVYTCIYVYIMCVRCVRDERVTRMRKRSRDRIGDTHLGPIFSVLCTCTYPYFSKEGPKFFFFISFPGPVADPNMLPLEPSCTSYKRWLLNSISIHVVVAASKYRAVTTRVAII